MLLQLQLDLEQALCLALDPLARLIAATNKHTLAPMAGIDGVRSLALRQRRWSPKHGNDRANMQIPDLRSFPWYFSKNCQTYRNWPMLVLELLKAVHSRITVRSRT